MFEYEQINEETCEWIKNQMKPKEIPLEFHGDNFIGFASNAMWKRDEEGMRVKYLEYLIEQL